MQPTQKPLILDRLNYFSDWTTVLRAIAHCLKYKEKLRERVSTKEKDAMENQSALAVIDLQKAKVEILKQIQKEAFYQELEDLSTSTRKTMDGGKRNDRHLRCTSPLYRLDPFLDEHYLLRVAGRLNKGSFRKDLKHPVILPRKSHITEMIISHFHKKLKHQDRSMITNEIRQHAFWIIGCSSAVYSFISKCVICRKFCGKIQEQKMSNLPTDRIQPEPPFTYSGVDFFTILYQGGSKGIKKIWCSFYLYVVPSDPFGNSCLTWHKFLYKCIAEIHICSWCDKTAKIRQRNEFDWCESWTPQGHGRNESQPAPTPSFKSGMWLRHIQAQHTFG